MKRITGFLDKLILITYLIQLFISVHCLYLGFLLYHTIDLISFISFTFRDIEGKLQRNNECPIVFADTKENVFICSRCVFSACL